MKQPFHKVIGDKLILAPIGINSDGHTRSVRAAEIMQLLDILMKSEMPADAASEIAETNEPLPDMLRSANQNNLADYAVQVLADLAGRVDEAKPAPPTRPQLAADVAESQEH